MKTRTCFLACLLMSAFANVLFAQAKFEKGYFINNENIKTECLIRNTDWRYNPNSFEYKMNENDKGTMMKISDAKEFGITNYSKYVRAMVKIDRSEVNPGDLDAISTTKEPQWVEEELFLKETVEGPATLYLYKEANKFLRFFFTVDNSPTEQLVYKIYRISQTEYTYNKTYISQLREKVNCGENNTGVIDYTEKDIEKCFTSYNACKGYVSEKKKIAPKRSRFSVSVLAGAHFSSLKTTDLKYLGYGVPTPVSFGSKTNFLAGVEAEYILPINKGRWSVPFEIYNRSYTADGTAKYGNIHADYAAIELALGARYYVFINDNFNIFLDGFIVEDIRTKDEFHYVATTDFFYPKEYTVEMNTDMPIFAFGLGASYKRISAEFRYYTDRDIFQNPYYNSTLKNVSLMIKYKVFKF